MSTRTRTGDPSQVHPVVPGLLEDHLDYEVRSGNIPFLEGHQTTGLGGTEHSEQGEVHVIGLGRQVARQGRQAPPAMPVNQEQHSLGQSSIPRRNPTTAPIPLGPSGIAPLTVPLSDYERLQKDIKELKHQNDELKTNNEENVRRLQGIIALLQELMPDIHIPHMGRSGAAEERGRSRDNLPRAS